MAKNDLIILDTLIEKKVGDYPDVTDVGEIFDIFAFENLLKDYELSYEEIEQGWVEGGDDGGIDGFFIFLDGLPLAELPQEKDVRRRPEIEVVVITCKHKSSFRQIPLNNLLASIPELFDLSKGLEDFESTYNDDLIEQRELFCNMYKELSVRQPSLRFRIIYTCRGDVTSIAENVLGRASVIKNKMSEMFSDCTTTFDFSGASELLRMSRKKRSSSLRLTFIENYVSRAKSNYVVLVKLSDYYNFITDEQGDLRRYLFESNVRDYLGLVPVNLDISVTLETNTAIEQCDFWWLNNGITIIATAANVAGKELSLENIQIVNGLQTTETIYKHFCASTDHEDERAVLVKIIVIQDSEVRDRIIKATNYQTGVELSSLRATEKIQRDIEDILLKENWFYDRRKNYYKNQGRPAQRIVSPVYLASCILAIVLRDPAKGSRMKTRFMRIDKQYKNIFNPSMDIRIYPIALKIVKGIEHALAERRKEWDQRRLKFASNYRCLFSLVWVVMKLGYSYTQNDLLSLSDIDIKPEELNDIWGLIRRLGTREGFNLRRLWRNYIFAKVVMSTLESGEYREMMNR